MRLRKPRLRVHPGVHVFAVEGHTCQRNLAQGGFQRKDPAHQRVFLLDKLRHSTSPVAWQQSGATTL